MAEKYHVVKIKDVRKFLKPEEQEQFAALLETIRKNRAENKQVPEGYFVLSLGDRFTQAALEAYIDAAEGDDNAHNPGIQDAAQHARASKIRMHTKFDPKAPTA